MSKFRMLTLMALLGEMMSKPGVAASLPGAYRIIALLNQALDSGHGMSDEEQAASAGLILVMLIKAEAQWEQEQAA